jgi:hypothetical protein
MINKSATNFIDEPLKILRGLGCDLSRIGQKSTATVFFTCDTKHWLINALQFLIARLLSCNFGLFITERYWAGRMLYGSVTVAEIQQFAANLLI